MRLYTLRKCFHIPFLISLLYCFTNCSSATQPTKLEREIEQLDNDVMRYHDEAMPKMSRLLILRKQLNLNIDTCEDEMMKYELQQATFKLSKADQDMMNWMHNYQAPGLTDSAVVYLEKQRQEIKNVRDEIFSGIENAERMLKSK